MEEAVVVRWVVVMSWGMCGGGFGVAELGKVGEVGAVSGVR